MTAQAHWVIDAHGRSLDLTFADSSTRRRREWGPAVVGITAVLVVGVVGMVLINGIHDVAMTVARTGITGVIVKALLAASSRQER
ncbi:hypothetical protein [Streptomyces sp. BRA346]|uniref:hypothetical protein n=1 Tax=Streptomyces sp. BRA346 TaxID=2878199 RepID=UPI00406294E9